MNFFRGSSMITVGMSHLLAYKGAFQFGKNRIITRLGKSNDDLLKVIEHLVLYSTCENIQDTS